MDAFEVLVNRFKCARNLAYPVDQLRVVESFSLALHELKKGRASQALHDDENVVAVNKHIQNFDDVGVSVGGVENVDLPRNRLDGFVVEVSPKIIKDEWATRNLLPVDFDGNFCLRLAMSSAAHFSLSSPACK